MSTPVGTGPNLLRAHALATERAAVTAAKPQDKVHLQTQAAATWLEAALHEPPRPGTADDPVHVATLLLEQAARFAPAADQLHAVSTSLADLTAAMIRGEANAPFAAVVNNARNALLALGATPAAGNVAALAKAEPTEAERLAQKHIKALVKDRLNAPSKDEVKASLRGAGFIDTGDGGLVQGALRVAFADFSVAGTPSFKVVLTGEAGTALASTTHVGNIGYSRKEWQLFEKGYNKAIAQYLHASHRRQTSSRRPTSADGVRSLLRLGRVAAKIADKRENLQELDAQVAKAQAILAELRLLGALPTGVHIGVDGIDAASKTSNGQRILNLLERLGFTGSWLSFRAPTAAERQQHWLKRHQDHTPKSGTAFLSDRTCLGTGAYNPTLTDADKQRMAEEVAAWQRDMHASGVLVLNMLFNPIDKRADDDKPRVAMKRPMYTFGKREGRAAVAQHLLAQYGQELGAADLAQLQAATLGPGINDLKSFHTGQATMAAFRDMARRINDEQPGTPPWVEIRTHERHQGRLRTMDVLLDALKPLVKAARKQATPAQIAQVARTQRDALLAQTTTPTAG